MSVTGFDHVAIPTSRPEEMLRFYSALGFIVPDPEQWKASGQRFFTIQFGNNKINVHGPELWKDPAFSLRCPAAVPGCGDFCFVWEGSVDSLVQTLCGAGVEIEEGAVERVGGRHGGVEKGLSHYIRDPDGNLLEFIVYRN